VAQRPGLTESLGLMRSDLLFSLGYALLWIGLFAMARKGLSRHVVVGLFHVATVFVALISAFAYQYRTYAVKACYV
jgi:lipoteichoic acid synthase